MKAGKLQRENPGSSKVHVVSHQTSFAIEATRRQSVLHARYKQRKMVNNSETNRQLKQGRVDHTKKVISKCDLTFLQPFLDYPKALGMENVDSNSTYVSRRLLRHRLA